MLIQFNFKGTEHQAKIVQHPGNDLEVLVEDIQLEKQFGTSFHYFVNNDRIDFRPLNPSHSDLYALQAQIRNAMVKQNLFQ